jgi:hypothetical protein
VFALARKKPVGPDHPLKLRPVCSGVVGRAAVPGEKYPRHLVDLPLCGLGGQNRRDQQFERGREVQFDVRIRVQPGQITIDPARSTNQRSLSGQPGPSPEPSVRSLTTPVRMARSVVLGRDQETCLAPRARRDLFAQGDIDARPDQAPCSRCPSGYSAVVC